MHVTTFDHSNIDAYLDINAFVIFWLLFFWLAKVRDETRLTTSHFRLSPVTMRKRAVNFFLLKAFSKWFILLFSEAKFLEVVQNESDDVLAIDPGRKMRLVEANLPRHQLGQRGRSI